MVGIYLFIYLFLTLKKQIFFGWLVFVFFFTCTKTLFMILIFSLECFLFLCISAKCVKRWKIRKMSIKLVMQFLYLRLCCFMWSNLKLELKIFVHVSFKNLSLPSLITSFIFNTNLHAMERQNNKCFFSYALK